MKHRTLDEMISYFNQQVSEMDIKHEDKIKLLGMIMAIGFEAQKNKWIPCSERLPEEFVPVLVNLKEQTRVPKWVKIKTYHNVVDIDMIEGEEWTTNRKNVTAWMPLPEPYKEADT